MVDSLAGKVAYITGAARGQGRAEAIKLASMGADIIALDLAGELPGVPYDSSNADDFQQTVVAVEQMGRRIMTGVGDVRDIEAQRELVDKAVAEFGGLDIAVANAGICIPQAWDQITPESFKDHLDINVTGTWNTVMVSAPHLIERGGGSIVLISSYAGKKMQPFMVHYTASKHAVTGMTRAFAAELGRHNIRVNSVHPGAIATPMGSGDMVGALTRAAQGNPKLMQMGQTFLDQQAGEAEDVANTVAFLAGDDARRITAEHISVDAGMQYF